MPAKTCPRCQLMNEPSAVRCDCGHVFGGAADETSQESLPLPVEFLCPTGLGKADQYFSGTAMVHTQEVHYQVRASHIDRPRSGNLPNSVNCPLCGRRIEVQLVTADQAQRIKEKAFRNAIVLAVVSLASLIAAVVGIVRGADNNTAAVSFGFLVGVPTLIAFIINAQTAASSEFERSLRFRHGRFGHGLRDPATGREAPPIV